MSYNVSTETWDLHDVLEYGTGDLVAANNYQSNAPQALQYQVYSLETESFNAAEWGKGIQLCAPVAGGAYIRLAEAQGRKVLLTDIAC